MLDSLSIKKNNTGLLPAVFLDRDGTVNRQVEYLSEPEQLELISGASQGIKMLRDAGFRIIVVTNQSGVARGFFDEERVNNINSTLAQMLEDKGAIVDAWYYCPHHPSAGHGKYRMDCSCRKPAPGMVEQACREYGLDMSASFMVGDTLSDMKLAWNCGMRAVLVKTGHGTDELCRMESGLISRLDHVADNLLDAAKWICSKRAGSD